jgi:hypothetical protein
VVVSSRPKRHPRPGDAIFEVSDAEEGHIRPAVRYPARKQILGFIKEGLKDGSKF